MIVLHGHGSVSLEVCAHVVVVAHAARCGEELIVDFLACLHDRVEIQGCLLSCGAHEGLMQSHGVVERFELAGGAPTVVVPHASSVRLRLFFV